MSTGDLTANASVLSRNEFGKTAESLNLARQGIVDLISDIDEVTEHLSNIIETFTENFDGMSGSIQNVSIAINEIAKNSSSQALSTSTASENIICIANGIADTSH